MIQRTACVEQTPIHRLDNSYSVFRIVRSRVPAKHAEDRTPTSDQPMSRTRAAAVAVLSLRIAYGAALVTVPERLARRWLGPTAQQGPTQVPLRALGAREVVIHTGALRAALRGDPLRAWLVGSIVGDLTDVISTALAKNDLPDGAPVATVAVGGGSALLTALLAVASDR
jgi:hypothetical protein